jgi:endoglucanase Acf2
MIDLPVAHQKHFSRNIASLFTLFISIPLFLLTTSDVSQAQSVSVGQGSYSTSIPSGARGPQRFDGNPVSPKISADFTLPILTNDFWSSLIFPFFGNPYSNVILAHPISAKATNTGLQIGYASDYYLA